MLRQKEKGKEKQIIKGHFSYGTADRELCLLERERESVRSDRISSNTSGPHTYSKFALMFADIAFTSRFYNPTFLPHLYIDHLLPSGSTNSLVPISTIRGLALTT